MYINIYNYTHIHTHTPQALLSECSAASAQARAFAEEACNGHHYNTEGEGSILYGCVLCFLLCSCICHLSAPAISAISIPSYNPCTLNPTLLPTPNITPHAPIHTPQI